MPRARRTDGRDFKRAAVKPVTVQGNSVTEAGRDMMIWVTLGLLAVSCCLLALANLITMGLSGLPGPELFVGVGVLWLFAAIPHGLLGWAVWRGRGDPGIGRDVRTCAVVAFLISLALSVCSLVDPGSGLLGPFACIAIPFWFTGWALGLQLLVEARRLPRHPSAEE